MRQLVGAGGKVKPALAGQQGAVAEARTAAGRGLWGAGLEWGGRGRRRLTRQSESQTATPGSCRQPHREWTGDLGRDGVRTGWALDTPLTSHRPAGPSLGPSAGPAVLAPPPQQLPSGSHRERKHGGRLRVPPRPTAQRGSGPARKRSMRSTRGPLRPAYPPAAELEISVRLLPSAAVGSPSHPVLTLELPPPTLGLPSSSAPRKPCNHTPTSGPAF